MSVKKNTDQTENKTPETQVTEKPAEAPSTVIQNTEEQKKEASGDEMQKTEKPAAVETQSAEKEKTVKLVLKHKSTSVHYHRCGLALTKTFAEYEVPESAVARLKADKWIAVQESR